jgi:hypothetical protein
MDENYILDIFEMMAKTSEPTKELIRKEKTLGLQVLSNGCQKYQLFFSMAR